MGSKKSFLVLLISFLLLLGTYHVYANPNFYGPIEIKDGAISILRQRLIDDALNKQGFLPSTVRYIHCDFGKAGLYLEQLEENGKWSDVDYLDQDNAWAPFVALDRMLVMTYAYMVLPGCSQKTAAKQSQKLPIRILSNSPKIQAVHHQKLKISGLAFYEAGTFSLSKKLQVKVDRACLLLINHLQKTASLSA